MVMKAQLTTLIEYNWRLIFLISRRRRQSQLQYSFHKSDFNIKQSNILRPYNVK